MKICYVVNGLGICGGVRIIGEHLSRLHARGHDVCAVTTDGSTEPPSDTSGKPWFEHSYPIYGCKSPKGIDVLGEYPVLVATEWSTAPLVWEEIYSNNRGQRGFYFIQMRESLFSAFAKWKSDSEATYSLPLRPVTISRWLKEFLETEYGHQDVPIVPNGVNFDVFYPDPRFPKVPGKHRVLIEGHEVNAAKNVSDAFKVVDLLRDRGLDVEVYGFNQIGPKYYRYDRFYYRPDQPTIRQFYSSSDILVKTTRAEGRSCVHPEAMACKCAVVTTDMKAIDDVENGNALVYPVGEIEEMAEGAYGLLTHPEKREVQVERAYAYVHENLRWDSQIDKLERIYGGDLWNSCDAYLP